LNRQARPWSGETVDQVLVAIVKRHLDGDTRVTRASRRRDASRGNFIRTHQGTPQERRTPGTCVTFLMSSIDQA